MIAITYLQNQSTIVWCCNIKDCAYTWETQSNKKLTSQHCYVPRGFRSKVREEVLMKDDCESGKNFPQCLHSCTKIEFQINYKGFIEDTYIQWWATIFRTWTMTSQLINNQDFKWDGFVGVKRVSLTFWFVRLLIDNFRKK